MKLKSPYCLSTLLLLSFLCSCNPEEDSEKKDSQYRTWTSYLGGPDRNHYSELSQITKENISQLKVAWEYNTPDSGQMQMNPIVVDSILYGVTAALRVFAINAKTGKELWLHGDSLKVWHSTSRGVSYWSDGKDKRILFTRGSELIALNAITGERIRSFGNNGVTDLHLGMPESAKDKFVISNTPGTIFKDFIIMPLRVSEGVGAAPGNIIAFHIKTGKLAWVFETIPPENKPGGNTWKGDRSRIGAANNWAGMAVDEEREIIYVPTGSAAPDFYGGDRLGSNLFSDCLLALNANTGELLWHFQFTHHDLWDRDPPAPPNLLTVTREGTKIPAVAQVTKQGYVYVFDRRTGKSLFNIEEIPVPKSPLEGEVASPTQPFPMLPKPFARQSIDLTAKDINPYAKNQDSLLKLLDSFDKRIYAPPSLEPVLLLPGYDGAAEWGGASADPDKGILYVNSNEMPRVLLMEKNNTLTSEASLGERVYQNYCATCHQKNRKGIPESGYPSLLNINNTRTEEEIGVIISNGKGMMTGFPQLTEEQKKSVIDYLTNNIEESAKEVTTTDDLTPLPYNHMGYDKFLAANGQPAIAPPWGTLHAIDLNSGEYIWSIPFGDTPELKEKGLPPTGTENYGGAVVTKNGLLFIGATKDGYFRVFNKQNGDLLWEYKLPAAAFATPAMYEIDGIQYIAIACGGEKLGTPKGNKIVAFTVN
ncbi:PQQ-binding-like beta-propeller repeat protein [Eudoraea chungangensis]|uniref:outer membrane protein assembly factor BamB family protein n=1 Tax=Eudoraea chungangensis TaxID=1481905 RepID=UPI0023EC5BF4|nr:PQQ-binding-like beta-propeller repeat protein [Eudoraea chungangensis]